jgi:hypothetical protein
MTLISFRMSWRVIRLSTRSCSFVRANARSEVFCWLLSSNDQQHGRRLSPPDPGGGEFDCCVETDPERIDPDAVDVRLPAHHGRQIVRGEGVVRRNQLRKRTLDGSDSVLDVEDVTRLPVHVFDGVVLEDHHPVGKRPEHAP